MKNTRREFLGQSAALAVALTQPFAAADGSSDWYDRPMRWAQLAFVEDDPGNYDPQFWLDYFRRTHCDAACLSAGGCVAFYPTAIPLHYRSKFLGDRDPFGEMLAGCRKLGMNVIARTDPHAAHQDVFDAHPDWIAVDAQGAKRRHWASPDLWVTCGLGPYNFEFMTAVTREIVTRYKVDGVFSNRWTGSGMCYCEHCRRNFREFSGLELPHKANREYILWRQKRLFDLWRLWDAEIKAVNPHAAFIANSGGGALSDLDMKTIGELAPTMVADRQARRGLMPPWMNGKNGKEYRAVMGQRAIAGMFSVGLEEPYRWKDSVQNGAEIRLWAADGIAHGLRPWFIKFNAKPLDRRWMPPVEELFTWHYKNEKYLRNERSLARVAMVYSQQSAAFYGGDQARQKVEDPGLGFYQALVESRIPFEMVHDSLQDIDDFRTLILPNIAALSTAQCERLRKFVERGGSLVATYETSLYDEWGARRADFGLSELFGASYDGGVEGPMQNSYLNIENAHPLVAGFEDAGRIVNGVNRVKVRPHASVDHGPLTLVPSYPDLPMEMVYTRAPHTNIPGVFTREVGRGRVVYFPWDIDRTFWEVLNVDHLKLLGNAVRWATNEAQPAEVTGPGMIDLAVWSQKNSMTVHMVNLTNPMTMKGPIREIIPMPAQRVRVRIPDGRRVAGVQLLVSGARPATRSIPGGLEITVPSVGLHEVVAIDLV